MIRGKKDKKIKIQIKELNGMDITQHYIDRYYERIFKSKIPKDCKFADVKEKILNDMIIRMSNIEMNCFTFLSDCNEVVIPFQGTKRIVIKDHTLITVTTQRII